MAKRLAEQGSGADALQLTLVPRFSFRARLTAGVGREVLPRIKEF
jgi:hypothetical protein